MAKKHFIVTFENNKAQTTNTLDWARENFPNYDEQTKNEDVYLFLVDKKGFVLVSDDKKFVCYNFNEKLSSKSFNEINTNRQFKTDRFYAGTTNFYIYFTIDNDEYKLIRNNNVTLSKNNINIYPVKPGLRDIAARLGLNILYNNAGNKRTTNDLAKNIFNYIDNNFAININ
jgi:hypothetical protein